MSDVTTPPPSRACPNCRTDLTFIKECAGHLKFKCHECFGEFWFEVPAIRRVDERTFIFNRDPDSIGKSTAAAIIGECLLKPKG
jgi:predicted amidophosphoribosyltransferase